MSTLKTFNTYRIENPILPGFYPDPSVCRKGDDFYIACSSFMFFPGIPLYHSRDLAHWEPIGYVFDRPEMLTLTPASGGLFAPTLRYHNGLFYLIVCNTTTQQTLISTAADPAGRWELAAVLDTGTGDPSLFWDDDGTCWCSFNGDGVIFNQELNLQTMQLEGELHELWHGAAAKAWSPEASHIYKKDGWYYLMIGEGGTEHYHAVTIARSRAVNGPYEGYMGNPILTHRHLSMYYPIANVGHADLVETPNGEWYLVTLGSRLCGGYHKNLGRETFLCPVIWESGWPVVSPETGRVEWSYPAPDLPEFPVSGFDPLDNFDAPVLSGQWNYMGTPVNNPVRLENSRVCIRATPGPVWAARKLPDFMPPAGDDPAAMEEFMAQMAVRARSTKPDALGFLGRRQQHFHFTATAAMEFTPAEGEAAGLVLLEEINNEIRLELTRLNGELLLQAVRGVSIARQNFSTQLFPELPPCTLEDGSCILAQIPWNGSSLILQLRVDGQCAGFYAGQDEAHLFPVATNLDISFLGSESCGSFVGSYIGMFAASGGQVSENEAAFDWFRYEGRA